MKLFGLFIVIAFIGAVIIVAIPPGENSFWKQSLIEKNALLENSDPPRLIFLGGSSTALGIDSEEICKRTKLVVVNEGLHGGMGLKALLRNVERFLKPGDVVILPLEYDYYFRDLIGETRAIAGILEVMPSYIHNFDFQQMAALHDIVPIMIQIKIERGIETIIQNQATSVYNQANIFNKYGDFVSHLGLTYTEAIPISNDPVITQGMHLNSKAIAEINEFARLAESKKAKVYLAFPPVRMSNCTATTDRRFESFYKELVEVVDLPVLSYPTQSCYPDEYFYDTEYHLNEEGRQVNTKRMIVLIESIYR